MVKKISCKVVRTVPLGAAWANKHPKAGDIVAANILHTGNSVTYTDRLGVEKLSHSSASGRILDCYV